MKVALAVACLLCSLSAWGQEQEKSALDDLIRSAEQGNTEAQFSLATMYYSGQNAPQHHVEAVKWFRLAAEQGYAGAQYSLGGMYYDGHGVSQDYEEAVKWYRLAAEQGHAAGQFRLGMCYRFGQGVAQDYIQAHM